MPTDPYGWVNQTLQTIHRANWYRSPQIIQDQPGPIISLGEKTVLNFASNDYLGLAGDPRLIQSATTAVQELGTGSTGSRLLTGHRQLHQDLERAIAHLKQTDDAVVFSSGYLANLGAISTLVGQRDLILTDQYNHSSLQNGAILSQATVVTYAHCDTADLRQKLAQMRSNYRRCLIVTDSVFSMDGDLCPLPEILKIADQLSCMVLVDEAHGTGVLGKNGAGCVEHFNCTGRPLIQMGTLSKALGSLGGYVAGPEPLVDLLRNRCPTWIYTTGLTPADTAAALAAISVIKQEPERRAQLWRNVALLKQLLQQELTTLRSSRDNALFIKCLPSSSPIVCLQVKDAKTVLHLGQCLKEEGIFAAAIRPPTVPTSRIRLTVMATHTPEQIQQLVTTFIRVAKQLA